MSFYKPSSQKRLRKFFHKRDFTLTEGGLHCLAKHNSTGVVISFPRHNDVSNGLTKQICDRLMQIGYTKEEIEREILK